MRSRPPALAMPQSSNPAIEQCRNRAPPETGPCRNRAVSNWHRSEPGGRLTGMTPEQVISATAGPTGNVGSAFYFHPDTLAKGKELGLDGMRFYLLGRGGVLGDAESDVVASAFGYFNPPLVAKLWNTAKETLDPREAGRVYHECCASVGRSKLADVEGLQAYCDAAEAVVAAAHPAGLALFAGIAAEPLADDLPGRAAQLAAVLRELRGSAHLLAVLASGLEPSVAHAIKRPDMVAGFGYENPPDIAAEDAAKLEAAEALTDQLLLPAYAALSEEQGQALVSGIEAIAAAYGV